MQHKSLMLRRKGNSSARRATLLVAAAASGIIGYTHCAEATTYSISTSGATALGSFNRGNSNSDAPTTGTIVRGPYTVGQGPLQIGNTIYNLGSGATYYGTGNPSGTITGEPTPAQDQVLYYYRESGSVQGVLDLADSNGLLVATGGNALYPNNPGANLFLWLNGTRFTAPDTAGTPSATGRTIGHTDAGRLTSTNGQPLVRLAWSDVKFEQAFATDGAGATPSHSKTPMTLGYGLGRGSVGSTNFQALRNTTSLVGGVDPTTTRLREETTSITPFNLVANPGTGLGQVTKDEAAWLQMTGRLPNGANFNSITREIGSGTRNQGNLNLGVDPSWGSGERDRRATADYTTTDINGNIVHVHIGDEADPTLSLNGSPLQDPNENRTGPQAHFSDKISGGSGVRATVVASRMGVGILSGGDSSSGSGNALSDATSAGGVNTTAAAPMRALAINWGDGNFTQANVANVTHGTYKMWTNSQAVTVAPYANPALNDQTFTTKPILGDQREVSGGTISTSSTSFAANGDKIDPGLHRKFLDNIINSVATANPAATQITPADFLMNGGFILPQVMSVQKNLDSDTSYTARTPDMSLYNAYAGGVGNVMFDKTNWADPHKNNGGLATNSVKYSIFASSNNAVVGATANRIINVTSRTNLAGDFDGDGVRDLQDVPALAFALANPTAYLATPASGDPNGRNYNGTSVNSTSTGSNASPADGLLVLSDFNSNGNVTNDVNNGSFSTSPIERSDVKYFLYGATVDTSAFNSATTTMLNGASYSLTAAENRRENGVRLGQLKKNAAIDTFNTTLNGFIGSVTNPATGVAYTQPEIDALKFDKFDVNGDGVRNRLDGKIVDRNVGKNYTNLGNVLATDDDLVAAELNDNNAITATLAGGTSDFKLIRDALGANLLDGDTNFDGTVDVTDLGTLATDWQTSVDRWSLGDFNFDGMVDVTDLGALATNWQITAPGGMSFDQALAEVGLGGVAVPEPASIGAIAIAGAVMTSRRRRCRAVSCV